MQVQTQRERDEAQVAPRDVTRNLFYGCGEGEFSLDVVRGTFPTDLGGYAFIVGPDKQRPEDHWFAGDGLVCRIALTPTASGKIPVTLRVLDNPARALRARAPWLFRRIGGILEVSPLGFTNFANTNLQPLDGRLFVGYDAGRPLEIDPVTLEVIRPVGDNNTWVPSLPGLFDSLFVVAAHPAPDYEEHALYFVNYTQGPSASTHTFVVRYGLDGQIKRVRLSGVGKFDTIHDVKVTERYVIFTDLPFVQGKSKDGTRRPVQTHTSLWIVDKRELMRAENDGEVRARELRIDMPTGHFTAAYAQPHEDEILVYLQHTPTTDLCLAIEPDDRRHLDPSRPFLKEHYGLPTVGTEAAVLGRYHIDVKRGAVISRDLAWDERGVWGALLTTTNEYNASSRRNPQHLFWSGMGLFPDMLSERFYQLYRDRQGLTGSLDTLPKEGRRPALQCIDLTNMKVSDIAHFRYDEMPQPPVFVPRKNARHDLDGYVLVLVHQDGDKRFDLFDAARLSAGPVASLSAKGFCPPLLLHSCFMPEIGRGASPRREGLDERLTTPPKALASWWRWVGKPASRARRKK